MLKLNLGSGDNILDDYINCDLYNASADIACDIKELPFEDEEVDEILATHIVEHFDRHEIINIIREWKRVLKIGGKLIIETPDFLESCNKFVQMQPELRFVMYGHFFAKPWLPGEVHKFLYTKQEIAGLLVELGFNDIKFEQPTLHNENPNIRVTCLKS